MPRPVAYVAVVIKSEYVLTKISDSRHGHVTATDVDEAVQLTEVVDSWWVYPSERDPRPLRLIVVGTTGTGRELTAVLYPVDEADGTWRLATAYFD